MSSFEEKVAFVADAITPPNGQPRTKARFTRYAREAIEAMDAYERAQEPSLLTVACRKVQTRAPFSRVELQALAAQPQVRRIEVSHRVVEGAVLRTIHFRQGHGEDAEDGPAEIVYSERIAWPR